MRHAGIVLAAGASSRMGQPKALLITAEGNPLAIRQVELVRKAGCEPVLIVLGCDAEFIRGKLGVCMTAINLAWESGRFSSVRRGLQASAGAEGILILPVDTVGVKVETLKAMLAYAEEHRPEAVRPTFRGQNGKVLWIGRRLADEWLAAMNGDVRIDSLMGKVAAPLSVDDPAILNNINTPEEWEKTRAQRGKGT